MSDFWRTIWELLGTKMLSSSAYHPQTDGQLERTNQTVELALRYFIHEHPNAQWTDGIPSIQNYFNNAKNATTGYSPQEIIMGIDTSVDAMSSLRTMPEADLTALRFQAREDAFSAAHFATAMMKDCYDKRHKRATLKVGDLVHLRLHRGYRLNGHNNKKLSNQRSNPIRIKRVINELAYELDLPPNIKIHPVVSIAHLEPAPKGVDAYKRPKHRVPNDVEPESAPKPFTLIEKILEKKTEGNVDSFLIKWRDEGPTANRWYTRDQLKEAKEMVAEFEAHLKSRPQTKDSDKPSINLLKPQSKIPPPQDPKPPPQPRSLPISTDTAKTDPSHAKSTTITKPKPKPKTEKPAKMKRAPRFTSTELSNPPVQVLPKAKHKNRAEQPKVRETSPAEASHPPIQASHPPIAASGRQSARLAARRDQAMIPLETARPSPFAPVAPGLVSTNGKAKDYALVPAAHNHLRQAPPAPYGAEK